jgi:dihydrofolate reductase
MTDMGKIVVTEFVSLDGVFEDPGGAEGYKHGGWSFTFNRGDDGDKFKLDELMAADAHLLGRKTYEGFAAAWPTITDEVGFAERMNSLPHYVVSSSIEKADWEPTTVIRDNVAEQIRGLKTEYAGDILVAGSGTLARFLLAEGLLDELRLMVFPIVLGEGRRLLDETAATARLRYVGTQPVGPDGIVVQTYALQG